MPTSRPQLPSGVYWRRRLFVLGTVAALVLLAVNLVRGGGDQPADRGGSAQLAGQPETAPSTASSGPTGPTGSSTPGTRPKSRRTPRPTPTPTPTPTPEPLAEPSGPCEPRDVVVVPSTPVAVAGGPVDLTLSVSTVESPACYWTLSPASLALTITDDGEDVWSSSVCARQLPTAELVARHDEPAVYEVTWDGREALPDCRRGAPEVGPGGYEVQTAALGGEPSEAVDLTLIDPAVPEEPDPEPKPEDTGLHAQPWWSLRG